jgi:hypothetical protein
MLLRMGRRMILEVRARDELQDANCVSGVNCGDSTGGVR